MQQSPSFAVNQVVWAKVTTYPWWPAQVPPFPNFRSSKFCIKPIENCLKSASLEIQHSNSSFYVVAIYSNSFCWILNAPTLPPIFPNLNQKNPSNSPKLHSKKFIHPTQRTGPQSSRLTSISPALTTPNKQKKIQKNLMPNFSNSPTSTPRLFSRKSPPITSSAYCLAHR